MQDISDKISRVLVKFNITCAYYSQKECTSPESWELLSSLSKFQVYTTSAVNVAR
jgi:hypothetical protein